MKWYSNKKSIIDKILPLFWPEECEICGVKFIWEYGRMFLAPINSHRMVNFYICNGCTPIKEKAEKMAIDFKNKRESIFKIKPLPPKGGTGQSHI